MSQFLEDSAPVLEQGTGTPYIALFKTNGEPIYEVVNQLPLGTFITDFEYVYEEEKEDHGKILLTLNNPSIVDMPELDYYRSIQLQWGYIYSSKDPFVGPVRTVLITNRRFHFTPQGLNAVIEFSDASVLLKSHSSQSRGNNFNMGFFDYLSEAVKGVQVGITILDYSESETHKPVLVEKVGEASDVNPEDAALVNKDNTAIEAYSYYDTRSVIGPRAKDKKDPQNLVYNSRIDTSKEYEDLVPVKLMEYDQDPTKALWLANRFPEQYRLAMLLEKRVGGMVILGTSKNKWDQLTEAINHLPNGPYYPDGRDGKLVFHNQKARRKVSKTYTWYGGNGELLEFTVDSKYVRSVVEVSQKSDIDPESKSVVTETAQILLDPSAGASDSKLIARWPKDNYIVKNPFLKNGWGTVDDLRHRTTSHAAAILGGFVGAVGGSAIAPGPGTWAGGVAGSVAGEKLYDVFHDSNPLNYPYDNHPYSDKSLQSANDVAGGRKSNPILVLKDPYKGGNYFGIGSKGIPGTDPSAYVYEPTFGSRKQAMAWHSLEKLEYTEEDVKQVMQKWQERYQKLINTSSDEARTQAIHTFQRLDDLTIKRKVKIQERVYPTNYVGPKYATEEFVNSILSSGIPEGEKYPGTISEKMLVEGGAVGFNLQYQNGLRNLGRAVRVVPGSEKMDNNNWDLDATHKSVLVEYETEIEIPISAARILSEMPDSVMGQALNDLNESVKNTLTAKAKIVGDPTVESSMNFLIRNVSEKYSGTWYIKKVAHHISPGVGYVCNVDFTKRVITNTVTHFVSKTNSVKNKIDRVRKEAIKALHSGTDKIFDNISAYVKEKYEKQPNLLHIAVEDSRNPGVYDVKSIPAVLSTRPSDISAAEYLSNKGASWDRSFANSFVLPSTQINK